MLFQPLLPTDAQFVRFSVQAYDDLRMIIYSVFPIVSVQAKIASVEMTDIDEHVHTARMDVRLEPGLPAIRPETEVEALRLILTDAFSARNLQIVCTIIPRNHSKTSAYRLERAGFIRATEDERGLMMECVNPAVL